MGPIRIEKLYNGKIHTYDVTIGDDVLEEFRIRVINEASFITHHSYNAHYGPFYRKKSRKKYEIQNYSKTFLYTSNKGLNRGLDIYHYEYNEYLFPYLVELIERLQKEDYKAIDEILEPNFSKELNPLKIEISKLKYLFSVATDLDHKILLLDEMRKKLTDLKEGNYELPVEKYYYMLSHMFDYSLVDEKELKKEL